MENRQIESNLWNSRKNISDMEEIMENKLFTLIERKEIQEGEKGHRG